MPGDLNNAIGDRGEAIFRKVMTTFHRGQPLFRVASLGDKWPLIDYLVELVGPWTKSRPYFFAQVKATNGGYTKKDSRLKIQISEKHATPLRAYKTPVYVAGVDVKKERVFLIGATGRKVCALGSMHTGGELDATALLALWTEVRDFWRNVSVPRSRSLFVDPMWR